MPGAWAEEGVLQWSGQRGCKAADSEYRFSCAVWISPPLTSHCNSNLQGPERKSLMNSNFTGIGFAG